MNSFYRTILAGIVFVAFSPVGVSAELVCLWKADNRLFEYQSRGTPGTCARNAIGSGIDPTLIEERIMTTSEWNQYENQNEDVLFPERVTQRQEAAVKKASRKAARAKLKALGLTGEELDALGIR